MCFTTNRLTGLQADKLGSTRPGRGKQCLFKFGRGSQGDHSGLCGKSDQGGRLLVKTQPQVDYKKQRITVLMLVLSRAITQF